MTELEMIMTDWLAKAIGLPECFFNSDSGPGAGMIQSTASDATLVALLSARARAVNVIFIILKTFILQFKNLTKLKNGILSNWVVPTFKKALNKVNSGKKAIQNKLLLSFGGGAIPSSLIFNYSIEEDDFNFNNNSSINKTKLFENHNPEYFNQLIAYCSDQVRLFLKFKICRFNTLTTILILKKRFHKIKNFFFDFL